MGLLQFLFDYMGDWMINYKQMKMQFNDPEYCNELKHTLSPVITKREVGARKITVKKGKREGDFSFFIFFTWFFLMKIC